MRNETVNRTDSARTRRRTQDQRSTRTIARLSDATIALMSEVGFVNMTTTSIAERAGVSRGAMLHHFASKVALVVHATGEMWERVMTASADLRAASDPRQARPRFIDAFWDGALAETHVSVSVDMILAARGDPALKRHLDVWVERMFASYRATARHAFGRSDLSEAECDALVATLTSALRGERVAQMMAPDPDGARAVRAMLAALLRERLDGGVT